MTEMKNSGGPSWIPPAVLMGMISAGFGWLSDYVPFTAAATVLLMAAGIGGMAAVVRPSKPQPIQFGAGTTLVGMRIRHADGISTVTEDLDCPAQRRCVTALDQHGRQERLLVGLDADGRVIEAAVPGADWAAAQAV